ncbi:hypothetical protein [Parageobacillus sp. G301]|jgi:hypothetical protein|uniref:hypothetical protein n=1 Tax=Parageobacillus sp. G301 TaxID=2998290 RepID=UPI002498026E|nr:hypothetical protein [Parageobacillus sp. G301]GLH64217.1 hypothetical protein PG301_20560 [Parageobacillus sp. G301]
MMGKLVNSKFIVLFVLSFIVFFNSSIAYEAEAKGAINKTVKDLNNFKVGSYAEPDYDQYEIKKIKNGTHTFYNTTYINGTKLAFTTTITVEKTSKSFKLKSFKISGFIDKKIVSSAYITELWIQYGGNKVKRFTLSGTDKILKNGVTFSKDKLDIPNFESINVHVNNNLVASANKQGIKYTQGIIFK